MRTAIHRSAQSVVLILLLAFMLSPAARASSNPKKLPKVAAAMQKAQKIFLISENYSNTAQLIPTKDFLIFYNGVQALGRYQFVATAAEADLILQYYVDFQMLGDVDLLDPTTLEEIGTFYGRGSVLSMVLGQNDKAAIAAVKVVAQFIGSSKAKTPPIPLPPPGPVPDFSDNAGWVKNRLLSVQNVLLVDHGVDYGFQPANFPYAPGQLKTLFAAQLASWGHYKIVDSLAQADTVIALKGEVVENLPPARVNQNPPTETPFLDIVVSDAKTLQTIASVSYSPPTKAKKGQPDPRVTSMQTVFAQFAGLVTFPSP